MERPDAVKVRVEAREGHVPPSLGNIPSVRQDTR